MSTYYIILHHITIIFFFRSAKKTGRWVRQLSRQNGVRNLRSVEREKSLLNTLVAVLCTFYSCWSPYGIIVCFVGVESQDESMKKVIFYFIFFFLFMYIAGRPTGSLSVSWELKVKMNL